MEMVYRHSNFDHFWCCIFVLFFVVGWFWCRSKLVVVVGYANFTLPNRLALRNFVAHLQGCKKISRRILFFAIFLLNRFTKSQKNTDKPNKLPVFFILLEKTFNPVQPKSVRRPKLPYSPSLLR